MRPIPIPDSWVPPDWQRKVLAAPNGDLTDSSIAPLEVLVDEDGDFHSFWVTEASDLSHRPNMVVGLICHTMQPPVSMYAFRREDDDDQD